MADVVTFGETMIRLSPPGFQRLEQTSALQVCVGGSDFNAAQIHGQYPINSHGLRF